MDGFVIRDIHKLIAKLQQKGFSAQQAEGITDALKEVDASALVTKTDLQEVKLDLIKWMVGTQLAYGAIRQLLVTDRREAAAYVLGYESEMPNVIPGTSISTRVLSELRSRGSARLTLVYSHKLAVIECELTRVSSEVMMRIIARRSHRRHASPSCAGAVW